MLDAPDVRAVRRGGAAAASASSPVEDERNADDPVSSGPNCHYKRHVDNLALGALDFTFVPSQMIAPSIKQMPTVGDLCVRLAPLTVQNEEYATVVDLYNTYCVKGSDQMAARCIGSYLAGAGELYVPAVPIDVFVSEWNGSLKRFRDMIRCTEDSSSASGAQGARRLRASVVANATALTLENVPALSEHLWFVLHCVVSKASLVREAVQLVGAVASVTGSNCHTGEVDDLKVPGKRASQSSRLYLIAKSSDAASGNDATALGGDAGASLGLVWVTSEEELFDYLRNVRNGFYVHLGTESGNTFRCAGFCDWRRYDRELFDRMRDIGGHVAKNICRTDTKLAGDTADSARAIHRRL